MDLLAPLSRAFDVTYLLLSVYIYISQYNIEDKSEVSDRRTSTIDAELGTHAPGEVWRLCLLT